MPLRLARPRLWVVIAAVVVSGCLIVAGAVLWEERSKPGASTPAAFCSAGPPCATMITGWLHTVAGSTNIYAANGTVVSLRGVNDDGLDFGTGSPSTSPDSCGKGWSIPPPSFSDIPSWGFNFVRVPISWNNLEPTAPTLEPNGSWTHHWNEPYLSELDSVESQFAQAHVAVIYDFAQVDVSPAFQQAPEATQGGECEGWGIPAWLYPTVTNPTTSSELASALCDFFHDRSRVGSSAPAPIESMEAAEQMLAARYVNDPTVIGIDLFNEPWFDSQCGSTSADRALLTSFFTSMGDVVSAANPHLLLAFEEPPPGLMPASPIISTPPTIPNAVYEFHLYTANWSATQPFLNAYLANSQKWGVPAWLGEFDAFSAGCTGSNCPVDPAWSTDTQAMLNFCNAHGVGWSFFSYYSLGTNVPTPVAKSTILAVLREEL